MIVGAAFCPHPPVIVPELASGAAAELDGLRAECRAAIRTVAGAQAQLLVLGAGEVSRIHSPLARGSLAGYGLAVEIALGSPGCGGALELPPSLTIGAWLLRDALGPQSGAIGVTVGADFGGSPVAAQLLDLVSGPDVALIVLGDGSARRSRSAPGYLDDRAIGFDAQVVDALAHGDADALATVDVSLAAELLAAGGPAWRAAGRLLSGGNYQAQLHYCDDPYGVNYVVATWLTQP